MEVKHYHSLNYLIKRILLVNKNKIIRLYTRISAFKSLASIGDFRLGGDEFRWIYDSKFLDSDNINFVLGWFKLLIFELRTILIEFLLIFVVNLGHEERLWSAKETSDYNASSNDESVLTTLSYTDRGQCSKKGHVGS